MKTRILPKPMWGIVPPLLTPLKDRDTLDTDGLDRLLDHVVAGGVHGVFMLGTTGEGPSLGYRLRADTVRRACSQVRGRVPVLVGITDTAFVESVSIARKAADCGADALVIAPPYYLPEGQPELREYLAHLLEELPLPLYLYNMPPITKVPYELDTVRWAMDQERIIGLKDSSGDLGYYNRLCRLAAARPDWTLLMGPEELLAQSMLAGGHGGVCGGANLFPKLYVALYEAARRGDWPQAAELQRLVAEVAERLYRIGRHASSIIKGIKCAAAHLQLCGDFMAEPFHKFRAPERDRVRQSLAELREILGPLG